MAHKLSSRLRSDHNYLIKSLIFLCLTCAYSQCFGELPSIILTQRQQCDLELLMNGAFSPLEGFMDQQAYDSVVESMHLPDGNLWTIPIVLDVSKKVKDKLENASELELRNIEGNVLAILQITAIWQPDKWHEASMVYGTTNVEHPGVDYLFHKTEDYYVGGKIIQCDSVKHYDFQHLRKTPEELKNYFQANGITRIVGFQTRNPLHRAHVELTKMAANQADAHLLIHPTVGMTKPGDLDHFTRVKCYQKVMPYYPSESATLSLLPLSMRMAGPREAIWHALIRKNYGCTHFIVGRDHAGPGKDSSGKDFYQPYEAQQLAKKYENEIGLTILAFKEVVYVEEDANYQFCEEVLPYKTILAISGTRLRKMLNKGEEIPQWFSFPEVLDVLRNAIPERSRQGFVIFFTGLSGAGKSTLANALSLKLQELQDRPVTLLDGDVVRQHLSSELTFSKEHRSLNVRRVGFVANEIAKNHGAVLCALIAPYDEDRLYNRSLIKNYIEVYVATSIEECEKRDIKGLFVLARNGTLENFTGISDPYEVPTQADIIIETEGTSVDNSVEIILNYLIQEGFIKA